MGLGLNAKGGAEWIGPVLVARLPHRVRLRWEEMTHERYGENSAGLRPDLLVFLEFFHQMVEIEEAMHVSSKDSKRSQHNPKPKATRSFSFSPNRNATLSNSFNTQVTPRTCRLCDASDHRVGKCPLFLNSSISDRKQHCRNFFVL